MLLEGLNVKWVSGATAMIEPLKADLSIGPYQKFTFARPSGIDGAEKDATFGLEVQKVKLMEQQLRAQQDAHLLQMYNAQTSNLLQMYNAISSQNSTTNLRTNCTSNVIGSTVFTNCR